MRQSAEAVMPHLRWRELSAETRNALERKLEGLYGHDRDAAAFDALAPDKQQALLILLRRFRELELWDSVRRIENVYGEGGVGMNFSAWPVLLSTLRRREDFTAMFARHSDNTGGLMERGRTRASLHFLYLDKGGVRRWAVHFDLYNPWASPLNAWRHLLHEKLRGETPDWKTIVASL
ncbi:MAG: hypothetical protein H7Y30_16235 [Pyrinomonadaceae bacterium]|nr:hypothetical protein [Pyrinomonadaceae bacterium]